MSNQCVKMSNTLRRCTLFNTYEHHVHEDARTMWADCGSHDCVTRDPDNQNSFVMCHSVECVRQYYAWNMTLGNVPVEFVVPQMMRNRYPKTSLPDIIKLLMPTAEAEFARHCARIDVQRRQEQAKLDQEEKERKNRTEENRAIDLLIRRGRLQGYPLEV